MRTLRFLAISLLFVLSLMAGSAVAMGSAQPGTATMTTGACPSPTMIAGTAVPADQIPKTAATAPATEESTEAATEAATAQATEAETEQATEGATAAATKASCPAILAKISVGDFFFKPNKLTIPAGKDVTFTFTNGASIEHYFVIDSQHISVELKPGKTVSTTLNLPKGTYEFYCKVPGHKQLGMVGQLNAR